MNVPLMTGTFTWKANQPFVPELFRIEWTNEDWLGAALRMYPSKPWPKEPKKMKRQATIYYK